MMMLRSLLVATLLAAPAAAKAPTMHATGHATAGIGSSAAYVSVHNAGAADRLLGAASPAATKVTIHATSNVGGVSRMRPAGAIPIAAGKMIMMKPGGLHIMLSGLKAPLRPGATLPLILRFEKAGTVNVRLPVRAPGSAPTGNHHGH